MVGWAEQIWCYCIQYHKIIQLGKIFLLWFKKFWVLTAKMDIWVGCFFLGISVTWSQYRMLASSFIEKLSFLSWGRQLPGALVRWGFCVNYNIVISDLCSVLVFAPYYLKLSLLVLLVCANRLQVNGMNLMMGGQYMYLKTMQNLLEQIFRVGCHMSQRLKYAWTLHSITTCLRIYDNLILNFGIHSIWKYYLRIWSKICKNSGI